MICPLNYHTRLDRDVMTGWPVRDVASFLEGNDLQGPSGVFHANGVNGNDLLAMKTYTIVQELRLSSLAARKVAHAREGKGERNRDQSESTAERNGIANRAGLHTSSILREQLKGRPCFGGSGMQETRRAKIWGEKAQTSHAYRKQEHERERRKPWVS